MAAQKKYVIRNNQLKVDHQNGSDRIGKYIFGQ